MRAPGVSEIFPQRLSAFSYAQCRLLWLLRMRLPDNAIIYLKQVLKYGEYFCLHEQRHRIAHSTHHTDDHKTTRPHIICRLRAWWCPRHQALAHLARLARRRVEPVQHRSVSNEFRIRFVVFLGGQQGESPWSVQRNQRRGLDPTLFCFRITGISHPSQLPWRPAAELLPRPHFGGNPSPVQKGIGTPRLRGTSE